MSVNEAINEQLDGRSINMTELVTDMKRPNQLEDYELTKSLRKEVDVPDGFPVGAI